MIIVQANMWDPSEEMPGINARVLADVELSVADVVEPKSLGFRKVL